MEDLAQDLKTFKGMFVDEKEVICLFEPKEDIEEAIEITEDLILNDKNLAALSKSDLFRYCNTIFRVILIKSLNETQREFKKDPIIH